MSDFKRMWSRFTTVLVILAVLMAILLVGVRALGYTPYAVLSGSMTPTYRVGDLVYVKKAKPVQICKGDVITFVADEHLTVVTHRVVDVDRKAETFTTKGDANDSNDMKPVYYKNVLGTVQFSLPKLGYVSDFVGNGNGKIVCIVIFAVLLIIEFIPWKKLIPRRKETIQEAKNNV